MSEKNNTNTAMRAFSRKENIQEALLEIKEQLGETNSDLIIFFASSSYAPDKISQEFQKIFPESQTVGCMTAGEIFEGELAENSIVAMKLDKSIIKNYYIQLIENMNELIQVNNAFRNMAEKIGMKISEIPAKKYAGIILTDGLNFYPEKFIQRINEITEIPFIGGGAGDDWAMEHTYVYLNGQYYENAAILILLEPTHGYKMFKTQSFEPVGEVHIVTDADEETRLLKTIDNIPAAKFFSDALGIQVENLTQKDFTNYSIGQIIFDEAHIHDIRTCSRDSRNLYLHSYIPIGGEVQVFKATDTIKETKNFIEKEIRTLPKISAIINFNCCGRINQVYKNKQSKDYQNIFEGLPLIGFGSYGEFYISYINHTSLFLVLL